MVAVLVSQDEAVQDEAEVDREVATADKGVDLDLGHDRGEVLAIAEGVVDGVEAAVAPAVAEVVAPIMGGIRTTVPRVPPAPVSKMFSIDAPDAVWTVSGSAS